MRSLSALVLALCVICFVASGSAQTPAEDPVQGPVEPTYQRVGTISELMIDMIYPLSDELFYIMREPPATEYDWTLLRRSALMLAEAGNLLMMPGRAIPQEDWMAHAKRLVEVSTQGYEATVAKDLDAIVELSPALEAACRDCHAQYHPAYGRRRPQNPGN